ncbi:MAG: sulfotransferase family protein [Acidimicrobiia bacterium]
MEPPTADELVEAAVEEVGLDDFGDWAWRDGLDALIASIAVDAALNDAGRFILRSWTHDRLVNRLRVVDWLRTHPEVHERPVRAPIVVAGMLRTGTTILLELLAQDPGNRPLMKWEGLTSVPPPTTASFLDDPRIAAEVAKQEAIYSMVPELKVVHWEPGDGPTECVALLTQSFRAQDWHGLFRVPGYVEWFHGCDMAPAYEYHRASLQLLQSAAPGRWVLKAPGHLLALDALYATYPDARLVVTHRDPLETVPSSISLSVTARPDSLTTAWSGVGESLGAYFARLWVEVLGLMVDRLGDFRDRRPDIVVHDLHYRDLVADPVGAVRAIYAHWGDELTPGAEQRMHEYVASHPKGRHGNHRYAVSDFGLREHDVRSRFADYCDRYDVLEPAR